MRDLTLSFPQVLTKKRTKFSGAGILQANLVLLVLIVTFGFLYLFQINALGTRGYEIRQAEQKIKTLELENKHLQIQASNLTSITRIQEQAQTLNMVPATNVTYLKETDFALR